MVSEEVRPQTANKKKFASKMRSIVSAVKTAQRLEVCSNDDHDEDDDPEEKDCVDEKRMRWN